MLYRYYLFKGYGVTVTNDGATILKSLHIDNPAAKVLVDISKVQDDEVGDDTTSVVLTGELLREAGKLVNAKISGFCMAQLNVLEMHCWRRLSTINKIQGSTALEAIQNQIIKKPGGSLKDRRRVSR